MKESPKRPALGLEGPDFFKEIHRHQLTYNKVRKIIERIKPQLLGYDVVLNLFDPRTEEGMHRRQWIIDRLREDDVDSLIHFLKQYQGMYQTKSLERRAKLLEDRRLNAERNALERPS